MGENYQYVEQAEPNFVKIYLDDISYIADLPRGHLALMCELLKNVSNASEGQTIIVNKYMKEQIADKRGISVGYINNAITDLVKREILIRIAQGTYYINPYLFGKGGWDDIEKIRTNKATKKDPGH